MAREPFNITHNNQLSSVAESIISSVPENTSEIVRKLSFKNTGTSTRTVTVYIVEASGSAATTNELVSKAIVSGKVWNCIEVQGEVISTGMSLQVKQDAGTDVNVNGSGIIVT